MELVIDIRRHAFGSLTVLENVGFSVQSGEVMCVIGPSGCGKSTLLSIVGGLQLASDGHVGFRGDFPTDCLNPFTYIFQDFALLPWRTVVGNVAYALEHHQLSREEKDRRVSDALNRTGLTEFAAMFPKQLSGGMRQRVGIARALAVRPAVLLMDEPLSALDAQTRELLMRDFLDLWLREGITGLYVTHNLDEAIRLADRIVVLSRRPGKIKAIIQVPVSRRERDNIDRQAALIPLREQLWSLIKEEAIIANKEITNGASVA